MNKFTQIVTFVNRHKGKCIPANPGRMNEYRLFLGVPLDKEYIEFQTTCGMISLGSFECYGLAMPDGYYLSTLNRIRMLRDLTKNAFPTNLIPLYNNDEHVDVCWNVVEKKIVHYDFVSQSAILTVNSDLFTEIYARVVDAVK